MKLTIITCNRPDAYIGKTFHSLQGQGVEIKVLAQVEFDGITPDYSEFGCKQKNFHRLDECPRKNASNNFATAILTGTQGVGMAIAEDDVVFTRNVASKLSECIKAVPVSRYILTLYHQKTLGDYPVEHINHKKWRGSKAVYLPDSIQSDLVDHFIEKLKSPFAIDYTTDFAIQSFCEEWNVPLFCCNPNLVQHIGKKSTLSPWDGFHISPTFRL
jgi:hypothetical protein